MNEIAVVEKGADWRRLKSLVLDSVSSPITKRVYNRGLDEFFAWYGQEPRPGFTNATVAAWRVALEARGLGAVSINVRITAVRKLAVEAADNGLLAPELANGITRVKGVASKGVRLATGSPPSKLRRSSTRQTPPPTRACGTGRFSRCSLAAASGGRRWLRLRSSTFSSGTAGGALWIWLASTGGSERCRYRLG
jgi:Phage integrase, N-terminal SAM-like domain